MINKFLHSHGFNVEYISGVFCLSLLLALSACDREATQQQQDLQQSASQFSRSQTPVPNFADYQDVKQRKLIFFSYLAELLKLENQKILAERSILLQKARSSPEVKAVCLKYNRDCDIIDDAKFHKLLTQVDVIPPSLALAQAANESAWGTSRFAREANNYFGQWCYQQGCGIVPARRKPGMSHEVRVFAHPQDSVKAYLLNLNSNKAYRDLRKIRAQQRRDKNSLSSLALVQGLSHYSERGRAYTEELEAMIIYNDLIKRFDGEM